MKMKYFYIIVLLLFFGCKKDDVPESPEGALLVFPFQNSECTTGLSLSDTLSQVTFEWQPADNTELYILNVVNLNTSIPQTITTEATSLNVTIEKGTPYSWSVSSSNSSTDNTATSANWLFYNAGPQINYAPFPAQIIAPISGGNAHVNTANQIVLNWSGSDVEDDIVGFEVYFGNDRETLSLLETTDASNSTVTVNVTSDTVYYWSVITIDGADNTSDSGIFDFKTL